MAQNYASLPLRGAWIEIAKASRIQAGSGVAPLAGGVD